MLTSLPLKNVDISYCCGYDGVSIDFNACSFSSSLEKLNCRGVNISSDTLRDVAITCSNLTGLVLCGIQTIDDKLLEEVRFIVWKQWNIANNSVFIWFFLRFNERNQYDRDIVTVFIFPLSAFNIVIFEGFWIN